MGILLGFWLVYNRASLFSLLPFPPPSFHSVFFLSPSFHFPSSFSLSIPPTYLSPFFPSPLMPPPYIYQLYRQTLFQPSLLQLWVCLCVTKGLRKSIDPGIICNVCKECSECSECTPCNHYYYSAIGSKMKVVRPSYYCRASGLVVNEEGGVPLPHEVPNPRQCINPGGLKKHHFGSSRLREWSLIVFCVQCIYCLHACETRRPNHILRRSV